MNKYSEIAVALDFAEKYGALYVTIDTDNGLMNLDPAQAREEFYGLSAGESFSLLAVVFDDNSPYN